MIPNRQECFKLSSSLRRLQCRRQKISEFQFTSTIIFPLYTLCRKLRLVIISNKKFRANSHFFTQIIHFQRIISMPIPRQCLTKIFSPIILFLQGIMYYNIVNNTDRNQVFIVMFIITQQFKSFLATLTIFSDNLSHSFLLDSVMLLRCFISI